MEGPKEKFEAESPEHFYQYFQNIKAMATNTSGGPMLWASIDQFGRELAHSIEEGKVSEEQTKELKGKITDFTSEGNNREQYKSYLKERAMFWREQEPKKDISQQDT